MKRIRIGLVALLLFIIAIMIAIGLVKQEPSSPGEITYSIQEHQALYNAEENGFPALEDAMVQLRKLDKALGSEVDALWKGTTASESMREFIDAHRDALTASEEALKSESMVAPPYVPGQIPTWQSNVRRLARLFVYDGHVKRIDGDISGMLDQYLNALFAGQSVMEQGLLMNSMVSTAIQLLALEAIYPSLGDLDEDDLRHLIEELDRYEEKLVHIDETIAIEKAYSKEQMKLMQTGMMSKIFAPVTRVILSRVTNPAFARSREAWLNGNTKLTGIGLRARVTLYELEHGESPKTLADVMDAKEIPIDLATGNPYQYENQKIFSPGIRPDGSKVSESSVVDWRTVF